jgi:hypothetical protein
MDSGGGSQRHPTGRKRRGLKVAPFDNTPSPVRSVVARRPFAGAAFSATTTSDSAGLGRLSSVDTVGPDYGDIGVTRSDIAPMWDDENNNNEMGGGGHALATGAVPDAEGRERRGTIMMGNPGEAGTRVVRDCFLPHSISFCRSTGCP